MSAILKEDPAEMRSLNKNISPSMETIIRHCLEKNPEERFQSARDLAFDLEMSSGISAVSTAQEKTLSAESPKQIPWKIIIPIAMIAGILLAFWAGKKSNEQSVKSTSASSASNQYFQRLTNLSGEELFPSIAPDGKSFVYVAEVNGNSHIFFSRVGGQKPIDLTEGSDANNTQPVFSPDGQEIAFRSEREGGGLFLMGATGESVKRVSDSGFNPSWSPDGKEIVYATEGISHPLGRGMISQIWAIRVSSGEKRLITKGDAVQPSWSPGGQRVAFWGLRGGGGQRDIWTVDSKGKAEPVTVTNDAATDWNPFWSQDGKYLYFVSDRGGTMNLWRVVMDESSGKTTSKPESVTTPTAWSQHFSITSNGEMIFSARDTRTLLRKLELDPQTARTRGDLQTILTSGDPFLTIELSPDRKWIAWATGSSQPDIFVGRSDGSEIRRLTNDPNKDRYPNWSLDGKDLVFMSDRSGQYDLWMIHSDGSGLRKATETTGEMVGFWAPGFSPDGSYLSVTNAGGTFLFDIKKPLPWKNPTPLPAYPDQGFRFEGHLWSDDSKKLVGIVWTADNNATKSIAQYSFETQQYETFSLPYEAVEAGFSWITPTKILIANQDSHMLTLDLPTKKVTEVLLPRGLFVLNARFNEIEKTLLLQSQTSESDIWLMKPATE